MKVILALGGFFFALASPFPSYTNSCPLYLKPSPHPHDAADLFSNASCLASSLGGCPDFGKLSWAALNSVTGRQAIFHLVYCLWCLRAEFEMEVLNIKRGVGGSGFILYSIIRNMKAHCALCKKCFLLLKSLVDVKVLL